MRMHPAQVADLIRAALPGAVVVMVTAHGDIASAVEAIRLGATDYLAKPIELTDLLFKARRASDDGSAGWQPIKSRLGRNSGGASATIRERKSSLMRICHGAPDVICSPWMKPSASQR